MATSRGRSSEAAVAVPLSSPRAGTIASRNGSATVAPRPRSIVRRATCFPVMNDISWTPLVRSRRAYGCAPAVVAAGASALFIRNAGEVTIAVTNAENL